MKTALSYRLALTLTVTILASGCLSANDATNNLHSLLGDADCARTCWEGIEPGVTSQEEALLILDTLPGDYSDVFPDFPSRSPADAIYEWTPPEGTIDAPIHSVEVIVQDGTVYQIGVLVEICVSTIISEYGEPPIVHIYDYNPWYILTYPQDKLVFTVNGESENTLQYLSVAANDHIEAALNTDYMRQDWEEIKEVFSGDCSDSFS